MSITTLKQVIFNTIFYVGVQPVPVFKELKKFYSSVGYCKYILHIEKPTELSLHMLKVAKLRSTFVLRFRPFYPKLYIIPLLSGSSYNACALNIIKVIWLVTVKTSFIFQNVFQLHNLRRSICRLFCAYYDGGLRTKKLADQSMNYILCHFREQKTCISNVKEAVEMQRKVCARQKQTPKCQLELKVLRWTRS